MNAPKAVIKACAREAGFDLVGIASAEPFVREQGVVLERLAQGLMGQLPWYTEARVRRGCDPQAILPGARSLISVACSYYESKPPDDPGGLRGRVARYAWGRDYHVVLKKRLKRLVALLQERLGQPFAYRLYVDDGPMLDREVARRAGVGFTGKNTNTLTRLGSWVFLGQLITDLEVQPDRPLAKSCGSCRACIPACPTGAITSPYVLDSNRCISYLTIEHRGPIARELRPLMGDWVFGCDLCQDACPVNHRRAAPAAEQSLHGRTTKVTSLDLVELLGMSEQEFGVRFAGSPIRRAKREGMQRNACIALGNLKAAEAVPALARALREAAPLVRGHAAWALGRIGAEEARRALAQAQAAKQDPWVQEEIAAALEEAQRSTTVTVQA